MTNVAISLRAILNVSLMRKCDEFYHSEADGGICILDDSLGIYWRIPTEKALLSDIDTKHPLLKDFIVLFR